MTWENLIAFLKTIPEEANPGEFFLVAPVFMFRMIGIWPLPDRAPPYLKHLYLCFGIATFANVVWTLVSIAMPAIYPSPEDTVADVIIQLGLSVSATAMSSPLFAMLLRRRQLLDLASCVIEMLPWDASVRRTKSMKHLKIVPRVSTSMLVFALLDTCVICGAMGGFITKAWFMDNTSLHGILIPSQAFGAMQIVTLSFATSCLFCTFVLLLTSQMEALEMQFDEILFTAATKSAKSDGEEGPLEIFQDTANLAVKKCILRHQIILTCMNMLKDVYDLTMLFFFLFLMAAVCCLAVCMTMVEKLQQIQVFTVAVTSFSLLVLLQAYCWLGTFITTKADAVATAAYNCGWYNFSSYTKKSLLLIIARTSNKFEITAAGFVPVNIITMVHILQETFSYILVMSSLTTPSEEATPRVVLNRTSSAQN